MSVRSFEPIEYIFKLVIVGDTSVGKTEIVNRYLYNKFNFNSIATVAAEVKYSNIKKNDTNIKCQIWDTAGQEKYFSLTSSYFKGAKVAIIVYDVTSKTSFDNVDKWINEIFGKIGPDVYIIICGNKSDLDIYRRVSFNEGLEKAEKYEFDFIETSAKNSSNISRLFEMINDNVYTQYKDDLSLKRRSKKRSFNIELKVFDVMNKDDEKKESCCG